MIIKILTIFFQDNRKLLFFIMVGILIPTYFVHPSDQTSSNFIIRDLNIGSGGGYQSSSNFKLYGGGDLTTTGQSSSTSFIDRLGFFYYPYVKKGTLSAVLNGSNAELTWSATVSALGLNVSGYEVGISQVSNGPYTYTSAGLDLNYTYTNLDPGDYFFVVRTLDGLNNPISISNEETLTVPQIIIFSLSNNTIGFNSLNSSAPKYATSDSLGSLTDTSAHNIQIATNASAGFSISYSGTAFSGPESITDAVIVNDPDGTQNTKQFALSFSTDGGATITSSYDHDPAPSNRNWKYTSNSSEIIASETTPTALQTLNAYYLANITSNTSAGSYGGLITYIATANF